jgi:hypothetical protein
LEKGRRNFDEDTVWGARDRRSAAGSTAFDYNTMLGAVRLLSLSKMDDVNHGALMQVMQRVAA